MSSSRHMRVLYRSCVAVSIFAQHLPCRAEDSKGPEGISQPKLTVMPQTLSAIAPAASELRRVPETEVLVPLSRMRLFDYRSLHFDLEQNGRGDMRVVGPNVLGAELRLDRSGATVSVRF